MKMKRRVGAEPRSPLLSPSLRCLCAGTRELGTSVLRAGVLMCDLTRTTRRPRPGRSAVTPADHNPSPGPGSGRFRSPFTDGTGDDRVAWTKLCNLQRRILPQVPPAVPGELMPSRYPMA